jgi:hypothetical protein
MALRSSAGRTIRGVADADLVDHGVAIVLTPLSSQVRASPLAPWSRASYECGRPGLWVAAKRQFVQKILRNVFLVMNAGTGNNLEMI